MAYRTVMVGAGDISGNWFQALEAEGVEIAAVVDLVPEAAQSRLTRHGVDAEASTDLSVMLKRHQPDFVLDLTVPMAHHDVVCTAMRAGYHVIGEKPMSASLEAARAMVRTSEETGRLYMVAQSRRWEHRSVRTRAAIASGQLGPLTTMSCAFYRASRPDGYRIVNPSPLFLEIGIHQFDLARYFTGLEPVSVYAREWNPRGSWYAGNAAASCIFEMTDGVIFSYNGSWVAEGCATDWNGHWRITGTEGTVLYEARTEPRGEVAHDEGRLHHGQRPVHELAVPESNLRYLTQRGALSEMLAYLDDGTIPQTECHDNLTSLAMVFAAIESARTGICVPVVGS